ncbi:Neuronal acetylcholine receptor subunit alpha-10 [Holothuria leucospilota]|uniref:Neuronal acetylcholine receptor subunit alpha-10 n=1 Tax=Holothuria leucospilota TaxID=206669 RepID=A0A9Q1CIA2_HOLLE|nr:Neuronal acetylcholine receptor subunit alpha-10 [Holothuria leucospilota]
MTLFNFLAALMHNTSHVSASKQLAADLISNYGLTGVRPRISHSDVVKVDVYFKPFILSAFDEQNQKLSVSGTIYMSWVDEFLTWKPEDYNGVDVISLRHEDIWIPDVTNYERLDVGSSAINVFEPYLVVNSTGFVIFFLQSDMTVYCRLDMSEFPFDKQVCRMRFSSFSYGNDQVVLSYANTSSSNENSFNSNGVWSLESFSVQEVEILYKCCPHPYVEIHYEFILARIGNFYIFSIWIPCGLLSVLELTVFLVHPNSGEKVSLSVTNVLAFILFQQIVVESMPRSGEDSPIIVAYFAAMIAISCGSVLASALVLRVYHQNPMKPVPSFLRSFLFKQNGPVSLTNNLGEDSSLIITPRVDEKPKDVGNQQATRIPVHGTAEHVRNGKEETAKNGRHRHQSIRSFYRNVSKGTMEQNAVDWKRLAMTLDKFFFIAAIVAMFLTLVYCMLRMVYFK